VQHENSSHAHDELDERHGHEEGESIIIKKLAPNEMLAKEMNESGIIAEAVAQGMHPIENGPYYSHMFGMNSRFTTNRGIIKITGKNFDLVQVLQKH
jgi:hypothetical protein